MVYCYTCNNLKSERNVDQINVRHTCMRLVESPVTGGLGPLGRSVLIERTSTDLMSCGEAAQFYSPRS